MREDLLDLSVRSPAEITEALAMLGPFVEAGYALFPLRNGAKEALYLDQKGSFRPIGPIGELIIAREGKRCALRTGYRADTHDAAPGAVGGRDSAWLTA